MLSNIMKGHEREVEGLIQLMGDIGGLMEFIFVLIFVLFSPIAEFDFYLKAIKKLYFVRTKKKTLLDQKMGCEQQE